MTEYKKGLIFILLSTTFWGLTGTVTKIIFRSSVDPLVLVQVRLVLSFLIIFTYLYFTSRDKLKIQTKDIPYFALYGVIGMSMVQFTYLYAISRINVGIAVFLQSTCTIMIFSFMILTKKEKLNRLKAMSLILSMSGGYLMLFGFNGINLMIDPVGLTFGLLSALFAAVNTLLSKKGLLKYHPTTVLTYGLGFGALLWVIIIPPWKVFQQGYDMTHFLFFLYIAVFSTVVPFILYFNGLYRISPTTASIIGTFEPLMATLIAFIILDEKMSLGQIFGALFVLSSIMILNLPTRGKSVVYYKPEEHEQVRDN